MSKTYNEMVALVRDWANRDEDVLSDAIVNDCIAYALAQAYRQLRVAELETTVSYSSSDLVSNTETANGRSITKLSVPSDLIEYIQIRGIKTSSGTTRVFNERTDVRTFYDLYAEKYDPRAYWTRIGNIIALAPGVTEDISEDIELHYYRKLGALNERYDPTAVNANTDINRLVELVGGATAPVDALTGTTVPTATLKKAQYILNADSSIVAEVYYESSVSDGSIAGAPAGQTRNITQHDFYGALTPNWLRDENERILLYGALGQVFIYLQEPETSQMYFNLFNQEVETLNIDERSRRISGGNVQMNVNGHGLI